jgi:hypothetical protein
MSDFGFLNRKPVSMSFLDMSRKKSFQMEQMKAAPLPKPELSRRSAAVPKVPSSSLPPAPPPAASAPSALPFDTKEHELKLRSLYEEMQTVRGSVLKPLLVLSIDTTSDAAIKKFEESEVSLSTKEGGEGEVTLCYPMRSVGEHTFMRRRTVDRDTAQISWEWVAVRDGSGLRVGNFH